MSTVILNHALIAECRRVSDLTGNAGRTMRRLLQRLGATLVLLPSPSLTAYQRGLWSRKAVKLLAFYATDRKVFENDPADVLFVAGAALSFRVQLVRKPSLRLVLVLPDYAYVGAGVELMRTELRLIARFGEQCDSFGLLGPDTDTLAHSVSFGSPTPPVDLAGLMRQMPGVELIDDHPPCVDFAQRYAEPA